MLVPLFLWCHSTTTTTLSTMAGHRQVYPIIQVHNQLVGAPLGSNITLDCLVEASPKPINYWARDTGNCQVGACFSHAQYSPSSFCIILMLQSRWKPRKLQRKAPLYAALNASLARTGTRAAPRAITHRHLMNERPLYPFTLYFLHYSDRWQIRPKMQVLYSRRGGHVGAIQSLFLRLYNN